MAECRWLEPEWVAQIKFVEWTEGDHLRDSKFMALRVIKIPRMLAAKASLTEANEQVPCHEGP
jgi:ATP-dependent DNA ligase